MYNNASLFEPFGGDPWRYFQAGMQGESGNRYGTLWGHADKLGDKRLPGGEQFLGTDITKMTLDEAIDFADPQGAYAQWVKSTNPTGEVSSPLGYYQFVGSTLKDLKNRMGLTGEELFDETLQDNMGRFYANEAGLADLAAGRIGPDQFIRKVKTKWPGWNFELNKSPVQTQAVDARNVFAGDALDDVSPTLRAAAGAPTGNQEGQMADSIWNEDRDPPGTLLSRLLGGSTDAADTNKLKKLAALTGGALSHLSNPARQGFDPEKIAAPYNEKAGRNRTADYLERNGEPRLAEMIRNGQMTAGQAMAYAVQNKTSYGKAPTYYEDENGQLRMGVFGSDGSFKPVDPPGGGRPVVPGTVYGDTLLNTRTGEKQELGAEPLTRAEVAKGVGKDAADTISKARAAIPLTQAALDNVEQMLQHPGLDAAVGPVRGQFDPALLSAMDPDAANFIARLNQAQGSVFLNAYQMLKGGGPITNIEGTKAEQAMARLSRVQTTEEFRSALRDLRDAIRDGYKKLSDSANANMPEGQQPIPALDAPDPVKDMSFDDAWKRWRNQ